ncbi:MAG: ABC transporter permease subunit, partial [Spirochaetota bacterium]
MQRFILRNFTLIRTLVAIAIGIAIVVMVVILISATPGISLDSFLFGPFRSRRTMATILETASPIIFAGLAIAVSFSAQQFYIGAEGAMYITAAVGTAFAVSTSMPWFLHAPLILVFSAVVGGVWGAIPGFLKARFNASEIVSALMLNFVAYYGGL